MRNGFSAVVVLLAAAGPSMAQIEFSRGPEEGAVTCGQFAVMDSLQQQAALSALEPLGGEMPDADPQLAGQWAASVGEACAGHPDRLLLDAATAALGGD